MLGDNFIQKFSVLFFDFDFIKKSMKNDNHMINKTSI